MLKRTGTFFVIFFISFMVIISGETDDNTVSLGIGSRFILNSDILGEKRDILISLPECYKKSTNTFPVLYLLDGNEKKHALACLNIDALSLSDMPPLIIVSVVNTNRNRDMIPDNGADRFLDFLTRELIRYIDSNYRTNHFRILFGESNSGLFTVYSFLKRPEEFYAYVASSPTVGWGIKNLEGQQNEFIWEDSKPTRLLYIVNGKKDSHNKIIPKYPDFEKKLKSLEKENINIVLGESPYGHTPYDTLVSGLLYLFEGYTYPEEKRKNEGIKELEVYYTTFSAKIGFKVMYPWMMLMNLGQRPLIEKNYSEAVEAFKIAVREYPGYWEPNIFLSLAYFKNGNWDKAKEYYLKAVKIFPEALESLPGFFGTEEIIKKIKESNL